MAEPIDQPTTESRRALYSRAFRPLSWWLVISAILLVWEYHRTHAPRTTLAFSVTIEGKPVERGVACSATVDNKAVMSGSVVPIGRRTLRVEASDAEPVQKSVFIWYGENSAGEFDLPRSMGTLALAIEPHARELRAKGPHHSFSLAESSGKTVAIPVGAYQITARFDHFSEQHQITVARNETNRLEIKPAVGAVSVASDPPGAQFRLASVAKRDVTVEGTVPALVKALPESEYRLSIWRGDYLKELSFAVKKGETNELKVPFEYGTLKIDSDPSGATIYQDGKEVGQTPLTILELRLGRYQFRLQREGFQPVELPVELTGTDAVTITTNLLSLEYVQAIANARREAGGLSPDYRRALANVELALKAKPGDSEALALKTELEASLRSFEEQQAEANKQAETAARKRAAAETFQKATSPLRHAELFDTHLWTFRTQIQRVRTAIPRACDKGPNRWSIANETGDSETYIYQCRPKGRLALGRHCVIQVSQISPDEVHVYGKFWDYVVGNNVTINLFSGVSEDSLIPVHRSNFRPDQAAAIEQRRQELAEGFRRNLEQELR